MRPSAKQSAQLQEGMPFEEALAQGNLKLARWLLLYLPFDGLVEHLDLKRWNGLQYACAFGDLELVKKVYARNSNCLKKFDSLYELPIAQAIKRDDELMVKFLRSKQSPLNGASHRENSVFSAIKNRGINSLQIILNDAEFDAAQLNRRQQTIWQAALLSGDLQVVKLIFQSRHCRFSVEEIRELMIWSQQNATEQISEFIQDYYDDFSFAPSSNQ